MSGSPIADSSAVLIQGRVLSHHQTAITLLGNMVTSNPKGELFEWLDLTCGRGQIIAHLEDTLPDEEIRGRISYFGYDIDSDYTRETARRASELKFGAVDVVVGQLDHFAKLVDIGRAFSFVTFTNTIHELPPVLFGSLLLELILRLKPNGTLFIYDMESLSEPELGAVLWDANDVKRLLTFVYKELGATTPSPMVPRWPHSSCTAWSIQLERNRLDVDASVFAEKLPELSEKTAGFITDLFVEKLERTIEVLEELTKYGGQTVDEQKRKVKLLYDFWSLSRLAAQKA
jgi:SAM-dependent methyltransferase